MSSKSNLQHCSDARQLLTQLGSAIQKTQSMSKSQASVTLATEYVKKLEGVNSQTYEGYSMEQQIEALQTSLMTAVFQLNAINTGGEDAKAAINTDFMKMVHVEKMVTKLQAKFRQKLAMKKLEKDIEKQKAKLEKRNAKNKNVSNEEIALQEFKQRLAKKGLTPESFYRTCDPEYKRSVPVERFK